jgi:hypothetical protein
MDSAREQPIEGESRAMRLYFVSGANEETVSLDLFVLADSPVEAGQMLIDYWAQDQVEVDASVGIMVHELPGYPLADAVKGVVGWDSLAREKPVLHYPDTSEWWCDDELDSDQTNEHDSGDEL